MPRTIAHRFVSCFSGLPGKLLCGRFTPGTVHFDQTSNVEKKKSLKPVDIVEDDSVGKYIVVIYDDIPFPGIVLDVNEEEVEMKVSLGDEQDWRQRVRLTTRGGQTVVFTG